TLADSSSLRACRRSLRRPVSTSAQPASAKRRAVARPKPEVAPVMKAILRFMLVLSGCAAVSEMAGRESAARLGAKARYIRGSFHTRRRQRAVEVAECASVEALPAVTG